MLSQQGPPLLPVSVPAPSVPLFTTVCVSVVVLCPVVALCTAVPTTHPITRTTLSASGDKNAELSDGAVRWHSPAAGEARGCMPCAAGANASHGLTEC